MRDPGSEPRPGLPPPLLRRHPVARVRRDARGSGHDQREGREAALPDPAEDEGGQGLRRKVDDAGEKSCQKGD